MGERNGAMRIFAMAVAALLTVAGSAAAPAEPSKAACGKADIPAAARQLGFTRLVIDSCPSLADVSIDGKGRFEWYSGHEYWPPSKQPKRESYGDNEQGQLMIRPGGAITTVSRTMKPGKFPVLPGAKGFYVEFTVKISDNDRDHFPAVWLMPVEHARGQPDHYEGDPPQFQRWFELDVDEGGFTKGFMGTALSWTGVWPHYQRERSNPRWDVPPLDRSKMNTFAAAFQPGDLKVTWWLNGKEQYSAGPPAVPEVALKQNFYLIVSASHHGKNIPYEMTVERVRAFAPE